MEKQMQQRERITELVELLNSNPGLCRRGLVVLCGGRECPPVGCPHSAAACPARFTSGPPREPGVAPLRRRCAAQALLQRGFFDRARLCKVLTCGRVPAWGLLCASAVRWALRFHPVRKDRAGVARAPPVLLPGRSQLRY